MKALLLTPLPSPFVQAPCEALASLEPSINVVAVFHGDSGHRPTWGTLDWSGYDLNALGHDRQASLWKIWRDVNPDIAILTSYRAKESGWIRKWAIAADKPYFMTFVEAFAPSNPIRNAIKQSLFRAFAKRAAGLGVMGKRAQQEYGKLYKGPIIECPYTFDITAMLAFDNALRPGDKISFLYSGRLSPFRDPLGALRAFHLTNKRHPGKSEMIISGDGQLRTEINKFIDYYHLQHCVRWMNDFADWEDLRNLYRHAHALVTLGVYNTWSLTVVEALAAGMPVIATQTTEAAAAQIVHGFNGYLVQHGDIEAAAEAMTMYIENPSLITLHGKHGRQVARVSDVGEVAPRLHRLLMRGCHVIPPKRAT